MNEGEVGLLLDAVSITAVPQGLLAESLPCTRLMRRAMYSPSEVQLKFWSPYRVSAGRRQSRRLRLLCFCSAQFALLDVCKIYLRIKGPQTFVQGVGDTSASGCHRFKRVASHHRLK